jgi:hypothetical protein
MYSLEKCNLGDDLITDLPLFRSSVIPKAHTWKRLQQPSSHASTLLTGCFPYL